MTSKTGLKRDVLDKFYTKQSAVKECFVYINQYLDISDSDSSVIDLNCLKFSSPT